MSDRAHAPGSCAGTSPASLSDRGLAGALRSGRLHARVASEVQVAPGQPSPVDAPAIGANWTGPVPKGACKPRARAA